jgi:hypothetical protein
MEGVSLGGIVRFNRGSPEMRFKRLLAMLAAALFATTAIACASMPASDDNSSSSSRSERETPNGYF